MNHLVVLAHPSDTCFCHALAQTLVQALRSRNQPVELQDLYSLEFEPTLSLHEMKGGEPPPQVREQQGFVTWADHLIFIFPVWWYDRPAILKGWIDRVFSYGFAYTVENGRGKGLLKGKSASIFATFGSTEADVAALDPRACDWVLEAMAKGTLEYCGVRCENKTALHALGDLSGQQREEILEQMGRQISTFQ